MRKLIIFIAVIAALGFWFSNFVHSGQLEQFLDAHPNPQINPAGEYYLGMVLNLANRQIGAMHWLKSVLEKYPKSEYAPLAWIEYIEIIDDMGDRAKAIEESKLFLQSDYASHPKAETLRKKLLYYSQGI